MNRCAHRERRLLLAVDGVRDSGHIKCKGNVEQFSKPKEKSSVYHINVKLDTQPSLSRLGRA